MKTREGGLIHRLTIASHDVKYYAKKRRWVAMVRSVAWRVVGWDAETCQDCGRRYSWSHWVSASELYILVKGNGGGTFCPRCFGKMAEDKGMRLLWTPIHEEHIEIHGEIMDGLLNLTPSSSAPTPEETNFIDRGEADDGKR